jgi:nucleoside-diphosphate-sugar epimerase
MRKGKDPMKHVLVLGACGNVGPYITPGLEPHYDLRLADIKPHPFGKPIITVDMTSYEQVFEACRGMDAVINFTVLRDDPVKSFHVNIVGMYHVLRSAREHGIKKVIHTGAQSARYWYDNYFGIDDIPEMPGTGYYMLTKYLSFEICDIYARAYGIQIVCFLFNGLGPKPTGSMSKQDFPTFTVVWEDLQHACRLALEAESIPDGFQVFNMLSYLSHGKYKVDKARRILGYAPLEKLEDHYKRS